MINSITEENQIEESAQLIDFPTVKVTCYYFEDCRRV